MALAIPAIMNIGKQVEGELFLQLLSADLHLAQMEALSREEEVRVYLSLNTITTVQAAQKLREVYIPKHFTLRSNYPKQVILFRKTGQVQGEAIWLYKGKQMLGKIVLQVASGRPKVELQH
jgi:hypothetical protein